MTRNANRAAVVAILAVFIALIVWPLLAGPAIRDTSSELDPTKSDLDLYISIADLVRSGENYYWAAISEQSKRGYPINPAPTVRTPTVTLFVTTLGPKLAASILFCLISAVIVLGLLEFNSVARSRLQWYFSITALTGALVLMFHPSAIYVHENWGALFLLLSLLIRKRSFVTSVFFAFIACCFRELAFPFILAMAIHEYFLNRRRYSAVWFLSGLGFVALYACHVAAVAATTSSLDLVSSVDGPSWLSLGGWPFIVGSVRSVTVLAVLPLWVSSVIIPLSLLGWLMSRNQTAIRFSFAILGFVIPFLFIGRPNNNYWALLYAAMLLPGFAFSFAALRSLIRSAFSKPTPAEGAPSSADAN